MLLVLIAPIALVACGKEDKKVDVYYTITINQMTNGSVQANKTSALSGDTIILTINASDGYVLEEGSLKYNTTVIENNQFIMPSENVVIYANFVEEHNTYTINYHVNEWTTNTNPTTFVDETEVITLANPIRKGFDFVGWYSDADCTQKITQIEQGRTGNIDIYPKFNQIFELAGNENSKSIAGLTAYGETLQELVVPNSIDGFAIQDLAIQKPCNNVVTLTIEDGVRRIIAYLNLYNSPKLETVNLPKSIKVFDETASLFRNCEKLKTINLDSENPYLFLQDGVLYQRESGILFGEPYNQIYLVCYPNGLTKQTFTIPDNVTHLTNFGNAKFSKVVIPASVIKFCPLDGNENPFSECQSLSNIEVDTSNNTFFVENNILYEVRQYNIRVVHAAKVSGVVKILEEREINNTIYGDGEMLENAFITCNNLEGIICSESAISINMARNNPNIKIYSTEERPTPSGWSTWAEREEMLLECDNIYWYSTTNQSDGYNYWRYVGNNPVIW